MSSSSLAANITVECCDEYKVQEITYDGQEKTIPPFSMSEQMSHLAEKIDFTKNEDEELEESSSESVIALQPSLWPWDSVRSKLRNALTEVSVLVDVMNIARQKKYLVLDPVNNPEVLDRPAVTTLLAKKKALSSISNILKNGAQRLEAAIDPSRNRTNDFHTELMSMRQNWRMKKLGNSIIGDLSYRSVGSRYHHSGSFEISKRESSGGNNQSALKVTIPPDLEGVSYIHVSIQKSGDTLAGVDISIPIPPAVSNLELSWQEKLESAQNVLFCKELFSQLSKEAVEINLPISPIVMGNQIMVTLFPGIQLLIVLCHTNPSSQKSQPDVDDTSSVSRKEHRPVLEHSLHQLLREVHHKALHQPMPHPISATLGVSRKHHLAGPEAHDKYTLSESLKQEMCLEQIMAQARHVILRVRTMDTIDSLAKEIQDPHIVAHWMCLNSPTKSSIKLNILSLGYESLQRTPLILHIDTMKVTAICRDGRVFNMSYESQELRHLLQSQVSQHQVYAVQALAKILGWKVLSFTISCGVGPVEMIGTASSLAIASPNGERIITLRHGPESGVSVSISSSPQEQVFYPTPLVKDMKWQNITGSFKEVAIEKIEGRNLVSKMEYLMASLTSS